MILRPYQQTARAAIHREWSRVGRTVLIMATGTGKTIVFASVCADVVAEGGRVLILAHRGELMQQAADKINRAVGLSCAVEKADLTAHAALENIVIASVQSLSRPERMTRYATDAFTHIIIDEAHHAVTPAYLGIMAYFNKAKVLGVTATPDRGDMRNLGEVFESKAFKYDLPEAIRDGYLCPIEVHTAPLKIDVNSAAPKNGGDFTVEALGTALDPYLPQIAASYAKHGADRTGLVFAPLCATAQKLRSALAAAGLRAYYCSGEYRDEIAAFEADAKPGSVMVNAMLLNEGYDFPQIDMVLILRLTRVRSLYCQMVGRGTRLYPGKKNLVILDMLWLCDRLSLIHPGHLITDDDAVAQKLYQQASAGGVADMQLDDEAVKNASSDVIADREAALAKKLEEMRHKQAKLVNPLAWAVSCQAEAVLAYEPTFKTETAPPTKAQSEALEAAGLLPTAVETAGQAQTILDTIAARRKDGLAEPRAIRRLEIYGFQHVGTWTAEKANRYIRRIAANGWRPPFDMYDEIKGRR